MKPLILATLLAAGTARAGWGPFGGGAILNTKDPGIVRFTGWEAGLTLSDPQDKGFWQFAGGRGESRVDHTELTSAQARLNFKAASAGATMLYAGTGASLNWLDRAGSTRRLWIFSAQAGLMIAPDRLWDSFGRKPPLENLLDRHDRGARPGTGGILSSHVLLGIEAGYHTAKYALSGLESRAYLTITY